MCLGIQKFWTPRLVIPERLEKWLINSTQFVYTRFGEDAWLQDEVCSICIGNFGEIDLGSGKVNLPGE